MIGNTVMDTVEPTTAVAGEPSPATAPENFLISLRAFETKEKSDQFAHVLRACVHEISRYIDLSDLDGITVALDYKEALLNLDRGYETSHKLTPSDDLAHGIAMTPAVMRDGKVKSHILLNVTYIQPLEDPAHKMFRESFHTLTHECTHVEINSVYNKVFPGELLQKVETDLHRNFRWQIIAACWEEYAATWISAPFGATPTSGYEKTFILALSKARETANNHIKDYRLHGSVNQVLADVYRTYGNDLMKFACYLLGTMVGLGLTLDDLPETKAALVGHWFEPRFTRLGEVCKEITDEFGKWRDKASFEKIGDIADEIIAEGGVIWTTLDDGSPYVDVPFYTDTMPDEE